jgi:hypothetical protein
MTGLTPDFCSRLVGEFADRTIAFWAAAIDSLDLEALGVAVERTGLAEVLKAFTMGQELRDGSRPALGYPELREAASAITRVAPTDHLTKARHI